MENSIANVLHEIQLKLKAPKNQRNNFGKYNYRSCEDILEAVKPLLPKGVTLTLSDAMVAVGGRVYVNSRAMVTNGKENVTADGWAREAETQKGMSDSQITGSASSYARKYALNGLFCIDDTKDSDATNTHDKEPVKHTTKERASVSGYAAGEKELNAEIFVESAVAKINGFWCKEDLDGWKVENDSAISRLKPYLAQHEKLQTAIMAKYKELENE